SATTSSRVSFSSRRRHTRFSRDWSSDVCSSDLIATVTGVFVALFLLFLFGLFILGSMVQQSSKTKETAANSVLYIDLAHVITEHTEPNPFGDLDLHGVEKSIGFNDILSRIAAANVYKSMI